MRLGKEGGERIGLDRSEESKALLPWKGENGTGFDLVRRLFARSVKYLFYLNKFITLLRLVNNFNNLITDERK
jgi:hypothetical protein